MSQFSDPGPPPSWIPCSHNTERCEFWTWRKDYLRPECCSRHLREVLEVTEDLLTRHGIFHFLDYGSLLGAVRSEALIAWDEDADFSCMNRDLSRVLELSAEIESAGFWLDARQAPHVVRICRSRVNQAHADIWFQRVENGFCYTWSLLHEERYRFPVRYVDLMGSVKLEGRFHPAPMPVERFLSEHRYGSDFMTPRRVSTNFGWISNDALSAEVQDALEQLGDIEYRLECLQADRRDAQRKDIARPSASEATPWQQRLEQAIGENPGPVLRFHRSLWKTKQRFAGVRNAALLEVRYELYRRRATLRLLERGGTYLS